MNNTFNNTFYDDINKHTGSYFDTKVNVLFNEIHPCYKCVYLKLHHFEGYEP